MGIVLCIAYYQCMVCNLYTLMISNILKDCFRAVRKMKSNLTKIKYCGLLGHSIHLCLLGGVDIEELKYENNKYSIIKSLNKEPFPHESTEHWTDERNSKWMLLLLLQCWLQKTMIQLIFPIIYMWIFSSSTQNISFKYTVLCKFFPPFTYNWIKCKW